MILESAGQWARKVGPWVVAAAILGLLFWKIPFSDAWDAAQNARLGIFLPGMLAVVTFWFLVESRAFAYLFSRFNAPLSWTEARSLRGTSYLLTPINWNLGTAAIILHLRRSKNVDAVASASTMLFYALVDGTVLAGLALVGVSLLAASPEVAALRRVVTGFAVFQLAFLALFMAPAPAWRWLARVRGLAIFRTHGLATSRDFATLALLRGLYFSGFVGIFWLGGRAFGVAVPLEMATAAMPAILLAGALPITPGGLGTQAAAMLFFFSPYGAQAAILAFGLAFPVALALGRCMVGLLYLHNLAEIRRAPAPPATVPEAASPELREREM